MIDNVKPDIASREDVATLIDRFYAKVRSDDHISAFFKDVDWSHHTPLIIDFWSMVLLGHQQYKGNPLAKHLRFPLKQSHFERWLRLFKETVTENFSGPVADEAKLRADSIASIFQFKMGLI